MLRKLHRARSHSFTERTEWAHESLRLYGMPRSKIIAVLILCSSTLAFADPSAEKGNDKEKNERNWTIHAARMYAEKGGDNKPVVTTPGVLVTAQRDPNDKK